MMDRDGWYSIRLHAQRRPRMWRNVGEAALFLVPLLVVAVILAIVWWFA